MDPYRDIDGDSNVVAYEAGENFIRVEFAGGATYLYTAQSAGASTISRMKALAISGDGLNAFINQYVRRGYERRER